MAPHVFTHNASYYNPLAGGVVDFVIGQKVDPETAIPEARVRDIYLKSGLLIPVELPVVTPPAPAAEPEDAPEPKVDAPTAAAPVVETKGKGKKVGQGDA